MSLVHAWLPSPLLASRIDLPSGPAKGRGRSRRHRGRGKAKGKAAGIEGSMTELVRYLGPPFVDTQLEGFDISAMIELLHQYDTVLLERGSAKADALLDAHIAGLPTEPGQRLRFVAALRAMERRQAEATAARRTLPRLPPSLVVLFHIEKTGGTALREWFQGYQRGSPALTRPNSGFGFDRFFEQGEYACFRWLHPSLFKAAQRWDPHGTARQGREAMRERCSHLDGAAQPDWSTGSYAFEIHGKQARDFYFASIHPHLSLLRERYRAHNGTVLTLLTLREPRAHLLSSYLMWPPRELGPASLGPDDRMHVSCVGAVPLPRWLATAHGLQYGALTGALENTPLGGMTNPRGCNEPERSAAQLLGDFDLVGSTACLPDTMHALERRLGWARDAPYLQLSLRRSSQTPPVPSACGRLHAESQEWHAASLNASTVQQLTAAAQCDNKLLEAARAHPSALVSQCERTATPAKHAVRSYGDRRVPKCPVGPCTPKQARMR